jgi:thiol-disulfide isomerase/thioredoxin
MKFILYLLILQLLFSGCSEAQHVYIQGEWENGPESVRLYYFEDAATGKGGMLSSVINPESDSFEFHLEVRHPTILDLADQLFIVLPGDTVKVKVVEIAGQPRLNFEGPKRLEHSFLLTLLDKVGWFPSFNYLIDENTIATYKTKATKHFDSCLVFVEDYFKVQSEPFETVARDFLTLRYYENLIYPVVTRKISKERLPPGYFDLIDFSFFRKADLFGFREYIVFISNYNKYFYSLPSPEGNVYDHATILAEIQSAVLNFEGEIKDHLLLFIFSRIAQSGTGQNKSQIDQLYPYLKAAFNDEPYRVIQIENFKREFDTIGKPLPKEVLAQQLKTQKGLYVSLNEVLVANDAVYVDFWASWCGPCLSEMPYENQLISEFKGKQIKFIFISVDKDENQWRNAIAKIDMKATHYLIPEGVKSALVEYLSFKEIPRYIIFDPKGRLISRDAPRPRAILRDKSILNKLLN